MSKKLKTRVIFGIFSGLFFAVFMAGVDLYNGEPFKLLKFLFHFICFAFFQGLIAGFYTINENKKE